MKRIELTDRQHRILQHFLVRGLCGDENAKKYQTVKGWTDKVYTQELARCLLQLSLCESLNTSKEWKRDAIY